jgi:UDP-2,4-diacetamido-2,4,6-trideoxy-beta-L-altropyranose hydrolase
MKRFRAVLRADASATIGAGHLIRSAALANALAEYADVMLASACDTPALLEHVKRLGVPFTQMTDQTPAAMKAIAGGADLLVVDGYQFDRTYLDALRGSVRTLAIIDDAPRLDRYPVDVLVDQNIGALRKPYVTESGTRTFLGPKFTMLRPDFATPSGRPVSDRVTRGLVTMGGADPGNATSRVIAALKPLPSDIHWDIVVGGANTHLASIERAASELPNASVVRDIQSMSACLASADLVIAAVGGTIWEAAAMGVPALVVSTGGIQQQVGELAGQYGAHVWFGDLASQPLDDLSAAVGALIDDAPRRRELSRLGRALIDGLGAKRLAARLTSPPNGWRARRAMSEDAEPVWEIVSDPRARSQSFETRLFPFSEHEAWFRDRLSRPDSALWVIERDGQVGGFVRYDREDSSAVISIAVATALSGRGLGTQLLKDTADEACRTLDVSRVHGLVFEDNPASKAVFTKAGFTEHTHEPVRGRACIRFEWGGAPAIGHPL